MVERMPDYPPEYDEPELCAYCGEDCGLCECPECAVCGEVGNPYCQDTHGYQEDVVMDLRNLCERYCYHVEKDDDEARLERRLQRAVFKYTDSGCSVDYYNPDHSHCEVRVSGYCEGSDAELPTYTLRFPFKYEEWENTLTRADKDADEEWMRTHGCEDCAKAAGYCDEWGNELQGCDGMTPVDPKCENPECLGSGVVI